MKTYTDEYQKHLDLVAQLEKEFDSNPNKKTAKKLSDEKNNKYWRESEIYTKEFLAEEKKERSNFFNNIISTINCMTLLEKGFINEDVAGVVLKNTDIVYPMNRNK